jgi:hypothetical protein
MFDEEMKYLHDDGFRVITLIDIGYGENSNSFHIKAIGIVHIERCRQIMQTHWKCLSYNRYNRA